MIYNTDYNDHLKHMKHAIQVLQIGQFFLKKFKCLFTKRQIKYLRHIVSQYGVEPVHEKILAIQQWPIPTSFKTLRVFLG